jgi:hypothetical protein
MSTRIIHIKNATGSEDEVYIGRAGHGQDGYFGSPVMVGGFCPRCKKIHQTKGSTLKCYESYLIQRLGADVEFKERVKGLFGKTLVCFCKHEETDSCHGDVLAKYAENLNRNFITFE